MRPEADHLVTHLLLEAHHDGHGEDHDSQADGNAGHSDAHRWRRDARLPLVGFATEVDASGDKQLNVHDPTLPYE